MPPNPKKKLDPGPDAPEADAGPAIPELVEIGFRDETFTIPKHRDYWDTEGYLEWMEALEANKYPQWIRAARTLLGPAQWATLSTLGSEGRPRAIRKDFDDFLSLFIPASAEKCEG
jgi:hypothetical protein